MEKGINFLELLRAQLQEKYGVNDPAQVLKRDFEINLTKILKSFYDDLGKNDEESKKGFINIAQKRLSDSFKILFNFSDYDSLVVSEDSLGKKSLKDLIDVFQPDNRTINKFILGNTIRIDVIKKDIYSIALGYIGWKEFQRYGIDRMKMFDKDLEKDFIDVRKKKKDNLEISGALIIDENFVEKVKNGEVFSKIQFFTSKLDMGCQWFGVINGFDVLREDYGKIKEILLEGFSQKQTNKVNVLIGGNGGSGKSTLLRRLAIDLSSQSFKIIWLLDNNFSNFIKDGLPEIYRQSKTNFLLFIEDWSRITERNQERITKFLKSSIELNNIRIIIGDRVINGSDYEDYIYNTSNKFELSSNENESIINTIFDDYPQWKTINKRLFQNKNSYDASLFLLIFIIVRVSENNPKFSKIDINEPYSDFLNIVKNDLEFIAQTHLGLAKALYYWASIYSIYRIYISYQTFLKIADFYNGNKNVSVDFFNWEYHNPILERLKIYINIGNISHYNSDDNFIQFNHDILADLGLSKIVLKNWGNYSKDDIVRKQILDVVMKEGDHLSCSVFLAQFLSISDRLLLRNQKLDYIKAEIEKGNTNHHYIDELLYLHLSYEEIKEFSILLKEKEIFNNQFWSYYFFNYKGYEKQEIISSVLKQENIGVLYADVLITALKNAKKSVQQLFCNEILNKLQDLEVWKRNEIDSEIICCVLEISENSKLKQRICFLVLQSINSKEKLSNTFLSTKIISLILELSVTRLRQWGCNLILRSIVDDKKLTIEIDPIIICLLIQMCENDKLKQEICSYFLIPISSINGWKKNIINRRIINTALVFSKDSKMTSKVKAIVTYTSLTLLN